MPTRRHTDDGRRERHHDELGHGQRKRDDERRCRERLVPVRHDDRLWWHDPGTEDRYRTARRRSQRRSPVCRRTRLSTTGSLRRATSAPSSVGPNVEDQCDPAEPEAGPRVVWSRERVRHDGEHPGPPAAATRLTPAGCRSGYGHRDAARQEDRCGWRPGQQAEAPQDHRDGRESEHVPEGRSEPGREDLARRHGQEPVVQVPHAAHHSARDAERQEGTVLSKTVTFKAPKKAPPLAGSVQRRRGQVVE